MVCIINGYVGSMVCLIKGHAWRYMMWLIKGHVGSIVCLIKGHVGRYSGCV